MKRNLILFAIVLSFTSINAQLPHYPNRNLLVFELKTNISKVDSFKSGNVFNTLKNESKGLVWKWDTIYTYDSSNHYFQRITEKVDGQGNIILLKIDDFINNQWVSFITYSATFNLDKRLSLFIDFTDNNYKNDCSFNWTYDSDGNIIMQLGKININNVWIDTSRYIMTYDNGKPLTRIIQEKNSGVWTGVKRNAFLYDTNGYLISNIEEKFINNSWSNDVKYLYTNDSLGNILTFLIQFWQNSNWQNYSLDSSIYDLQGNLTQYSQYKGFSTSFSKFQRFTYTYDINNLKKSMVFELGMLNWEKYENFTFFYDSNNYLIKEINKYWNPFDSIWEFDYQLIWQYDLNGNLLTHYSELYKNNSWVNNIKDSWSFDSNNNSIAGKSEVFVNNNWYNNKKELSSLFKIGGDILIEPVYSYCHKFETHYSQLQIGIQENTIKNNSISIFPNPAQNSISIVIPQAEKESFVTIYNLSGQKISQLQFIGEKTNVDLSALKSGIYIVEVRNDKMVEVKKVVKK